jgi:hypothetical protein
MDFFALIRLAGAFPTFFAAACLGVLSFWKNPGSLYSFKTERRRLLWHMVYHHPKNQERALNLSILTLSGITSVFFPRSCVCSTSVVFSSTSSCASTARPTACMLLLAAHACSSPSGCVKAHRVLSASQPPEDLQTTIRRPQVTLKKNPPTAR